MRLKIYWLIYRKRLSLTLQTALANKQAAVFFVTGKLLRYFFLLLMITQVGKQVTLIGGFTLQQMILFYLIYNLVDNLSQLLFRGVYWFRDILINGNFDYSLLRPIHPIFTTLAWYPDFLDIPLTVFVAFVLVKTIIGLPIISILLAFGFILVSILIMLSMHILAIAFGIFTLEVDNVIMLLRDFWFMGRVPIDIYAWPVRFFLTFIVPVALLMTVPGKALMGLVGWETLGLAFVVGLFMVWFSIQIWNLALRKYASASS